MAEGGRRLEINVSADMEGNYPDSVSSSPRSRETDSDYFGGSTNQRWEAVDQGGSSTGSLSGRVRLMCSCGGKILPRPHDNQLAYVGGDTRILAVERSIRFSSMSSKLSNLWGSGVSFKYQLPNEDLDSLISVTNDEDLDNMMAEYDRLQKSGYKFSRLRLFVFPNQNAQGSNSSLGSLLEESRREQWFVEALNNPPVTQGNSNRSDGGSVSEAAAWVNHMPDFLFGLENSSVGIHNNGGTEEDRIPRPNSFDSDASARIDSNRTGPSAGVRIDAQIGTNPVSDQAEKGNRNSNSSPRQEIGIPAPSKPNLQPDVSIDVINQRSPTQQQQLPPQVRLQDFQNLQLKQQHQEYQLKQQDYQLKQQDQQMYQQDQQMQQQDQQMQQQDYQLRQQDQQMQQQDYQLKQQDQQMQQQEQDSMPRAMEETFMNLQGRKIYPDPARAMNLSSQGQEVYMQQPSQPDYYRQDQQQQQQQQQKQQPSQPNYYRQEQQHPPQQPVSYWQMHDQGGNSQYPVYLVPSGANMLQTMTAVRPGPAPGYYNPSQRVNAAPSVYDAPGLVTTVRAAAQRQQQQQQQQAGGVSEVAAADPYREPQPQPVMPLQPPPVSKVTTVYGAPMQLPVAGDVRMMYRATAPVNSMPIQHPESYGYPPQHVVYDPNMNAARQMYYTQAVNPQYQPVGPIASEVNVAPSLDVTTATAAAAAAPPEQQVKLGRVSQGTS